MLKFSMLIFIYSSSPDFQMNRSYKIASCCMLRSENRGTPGQVMNFSIDFRDMLRHLVFIAHLFFILGDFYSYSRGVIYIHMEFRRAGGE